MAAAKKGDGPVSQFLMFIAISLLVLTIFFPSINAAVGEWLNRFLNPLIGFDGKRPAFTIFLASGLMVVITTALRHVFMDWAEMARVQDVMRVYQSELKQATKENNKFKIKQLTDMQPEIMKMQTNMSGAQLKPMLLTMVVIIPTFTWLFAFVTAYVPHDVGLSEDSDPVALIAVDKDLLQFEAIGSGNKTVMKAWQHTTVTIVPIEFDFVRAKGGGTATISKGELAVAEINANATLPFDSAGIPPVQLPPGEYKVTNAGNNLRVLHASTNEPVEGRFANHFGLIVFGNASLPTRALKISPGTQAGVIFEENDTGYIIVPLVEGEALAGEAGVVFTGASKNQTVNVTSANVYPLTKGAPPLVLQPHSMALPWVGEWDLLAAWWVLPHWIIYYSVASIGFGTFVQKGLRLLDYAIERRRDPAGG